MNPQAGFSHSELLTATSLQTRFADRNVALCCCCCSIPKSCPTLGCPIDCSTPCFPGLRYLLEFGQTHVHWIGDAIQPSHPLVPPSPFACSLSQHHGIFPISQLFESGDQNIGDSTSVLPMNIQDWFPLGLPGLISLQSKGLSRVFSSTTVLRGTKKLWYIVNELGHAIQVDCQKYFGSWIPLKKYHWPVGLGIFEKTRKKSITSSEVHSLFNW